MEYNPNPSNSANNAPRSWDDADPLQKFEAFLKMKDNRDRIHRENRERANREIRYGFT